jgi:hypothetical protein
MLVFEGRHVDIGEQPAEEDQTSGYYTILPAGTSAGLPASPKASGSMPRCFNFGVVLQQRTGSVVMLVLLG